MYLFLPFSKRPQIRFRNVLLLILLWTGAAVGQLTQSGFTGVTVPQYTASGSSSRMPIMFRATVTGLTANTSYRYFINVALSTDFGGSNPGAGNPLMIDSSGNYTYSTGASLSSSGNYSTFTTNASGNYTGWFGFVNTGNARFTAGNIVYPTIAIGTSSGTLVGYRALDQSMTVLAFATTSSATSGTLAKSTTSATGENIAVIYDNTAGSGRPLACSPVESIGITIASLPATYSNAAGTWNAIIPNVNANGVQRIEQRNVLTNSLIGCATDNDGIWPTGNISTVNPAGSTTSPKIINGADDPLTSCAGVPSITATGSFGSFTTTYGTASAVQTITVSGSGLTNNISISVPAGYEVSVTSPGTGGYSTSQTLTQSGGTVASTTVYVRLAATTLSGSYSGNVSLTSSPATPVNISIASGTVNKKSLNLASASAVSKVYDGNALATISGTLNGAVNGDVLTVSGGGNFSNKNVGSGKPVTANLMVSGTHATSYNFVQPTGLSANITLKDVTIGSASVDSKEYDGNTSATLNGTLTGAISGDDVTLVPLAGFDLPFPGTDIPVTSFSSLSGLDAGNYNLVQPVGLTADITAKALTIANAVALNKVYDGTTDAVITGVLSGAIPGDNVDFDGTGIFDSPNVGLNIPVTSTCTLVGADAGNYTLIQPAGLTANISSGALTPQDITFDPLAPVVYGDAPFDLTATASSGLTVTYTSSDDSIATVSGNTVTITGVGTVDITAFQGGNLTYDSAPPVTQTLTVLPKELTVSSPAVDTKTYDATTDATFTGTLNGIVGSDDVTLIGIGIFDTANAGTGIGVISTAALSGVNADRYFLTQPDFLSGNIDPKPLTLTDATAQNKVYDGTTDAAIAGGTLNGIIGLDDVSYSGAGIFADKNVADGIPVSGALILTGAQASNYSLTQPAGLAADITPAGLTVTGISGVDRTYDGDIDAALSGTAVPSGVFGSDDVSIAGTPVAVFASKNVGTAKPITINGFTLAGTDAGNYTLTQPSANADITVAPLSIPDAVAHDKVFDGTTAATITGTLSGIFGSDVVVLLGTGVFDSPAIGTNIPVTSTATLAGADASNYEINPQPTGLTADITTQPSFTQGRIVVARVGATGQGSAPTSAGNPVFLCEYSTDGSQGITVALPTTTSGNVNRIVDSGSATSEVQLNLSQNHQYLTVGGYDAAVGTASVNSSALNRVIARIDNAGAVETTLFTNATHGSGFRSVVTADGTRYWTAGNGTGVASVTHQGNTTPVAVTAITTSPTNLRTVSIYNGQLYVSTGSGTNGVYKVGTGIPSTSGQTAANVVAVSNPYAYYMVNRGGTNWNCYLAVEATGIAKFSSADNGASWTSRGTVTNASGSIYSLVAQVTGGNVDIYATTPSALVKLTDTAAFNANISGTPAVLASAPVNTNFRGLSFAPYLDAPPTAAVISGGGMICAGGSSTLSVSVTGGTSPYTVVYTDGTNNFTISNYSSGDSISISPSATTTYTLVSVTDANSQMGTGFSGAAVVTVNAPQTYYADADNDGYGNPAVSQQFCGDGVDHTGYVLDNTDCNDSDDTLHQSFDFYVDADNDGYGTGGAVSVCAASSSAAPAGYSVFDTDCDDTRATVHPGAVEIGYNLIDDDCDGLIDEGFPPKQTVLGSSQCNTTLAAIDTPLTAGIVAGAQGYRWRITAMSGSSAGEVQEIDTPLRTLRLIQLAHYAFNTTYKVEVAVYYAGYLQPYQPSGCTVTTPAVATQLGNCNQQLTNMGDGVYAYIIPYATGYKFRITDPLVPTNTQEIERPIRDVRLTMVNAFAVQYGKSYNIEVAVRNTDGSYLPYGPVCTVNTPSFPTVSLSDSQCDDYAVPSAGTQIYAGSYPGAIRYVFQITGPGLGSGYTLTKTIRSFILAEVPGWIATNLYTVKVRMVFNDADPAGPFGKSCTIVAPGLARMANVKGLAFDAVAYPNPFADSFSVKVTTASSQDITVKVYDMTGRLIGQENAGGQQEISLGTNYPSGVYNVVVSQGDQVKTLRVLKR